MRIAIDTEPYNTTRSGRPWIAVVDFAVRGKNQYRFGRWLGDAGGRWSSEGVLFLEADVGDIVATGQKNRDRPDAKPRFYAVDGAGGLFALDSRADAAVAFRNNRTWDRDEADRPQHWDPINEPPSAMSLRIAPGLTLTNEIPESVRGLPVLELRTASRRKVLGYADPIAIDGTTCSATRLVSAWLRDANLLPPEREFAELFFP